MPVAPRSVRPPLLLLSAAAAAASRLSAIVAAADADAPTCGGAGAPCTLYIAPSALPYAGLGLYTMVDIPEGTVIGSSGGGGGADDEGENDGRGGSGGAPPPPLEDLFVPVEDLFKTLPYRGQQRFMSWLGYVWPSEIDAFYPSREFGSFPKIPEAFQRLDEGLNGADGLYFYRDVEGNEEDEEAANAFAPGIASLVNSHPELGNIVKVHESEKTDYAGLENDDGEEAFTPHYGVSFVAVKDIAAGSELYIYYGDQWHERYDLILEQEREEDGDLWLARDKKVRSDVPKRLPSESRKRRRMERMGTEINELVGGAEIERNLVTGERAYTELSTDNNIGHDDYDEDKGYEYDEDEDDDDDEDEENYHGYKEADTIQSIEWLSKNGLCVDTLRAVQSKVDRAGRGAFAQKFIPNGSIIAPAPLLALKRDDLIIYESDEEKELYRDVLDLDKVVGRELLLNYCYGHPESPLLLLPYSPVVNFINHDSKEPNAEIRWPSMTSPFFDGSRKWLSMHPLDVQDHSGELMTEFVALRDIQPGEEILIDYGREWEAAWREHLSSSEGGAKSEEKRKPFRHEIGVPDLFYPRAWKNKSSTYEVAPLDSPLEPGELSLMRWAHNGEPIAKNLYRAGLPRGFSAKMREYSDRAGITALYERLLSLSKEDVLDDDEFQVFETGGEQWFAHRYMSKAWKFNMHYIAAWDEKARKSFLGAHGEAGFDAVLEGTGKLMGLTNMTCFHPSFMGATQCDNSMTHADVYSTGERGFNYLYPILVVNGSAPELDIQSDDVNVVVGVNYEYDVAYALGDWVYHKTRPIEYPDESQIRVVVGMYCSQIDADNARMMAYIYDGEDPAPFMNQFKLPLKEAHWGNEHKLPTVKTEK